MNKGLFTIPAVALCLVAIAAAPAQKVEGGGGFRLGVDNEGIATITVDIEQKKEGEAKGFFQFAAEDHAHIGRYPNTVIILKSFDTVKFEGNKVRIEGHGTLRGNPVHVITELTDNGPGNPDRVTLATHSHTGVNDHDHSYNFSKLLNSGDIVIGGGKKS